MPSSLHGASVSGSLSSLSESEPGARGGGGPRVKLVYDQVLNCYF